MTPRIIVVGSSNTDMVIQTSHIPQPGETVLGGTFFMNAGGKGANQAVAAARCGGQVSFIGKIGNDIFGQSARQGLQKEGIDVTGLRVDPSLPSGIALITVDTKGENSIVVAPGANAALSAADLQDLDSLEPPAYILTQLETPLASLEVLAELAMQKSIPLVLNPAPACPLPDSLLSKLAIITPNETEAEILTGIKVTDLGSAQQAAGQLNKKGVPTVIITLGANGAAIFHKNTFTHIKGMKVAAVDSTAAGDVFNGALVVALAEGKEMAQAVEFACKAAAISVTRLGAQSSAPYREEIPV